MAKMFNFFVFKLSSSVLEVYKQMKYFSLLY